MSATDIVHSMKSNNTNIAPQDSTFRNVQAILSRNFPSATPSHLGPIVVCWHRDQSRLRPAAGWIDKNAPCLKKKYQ